MTDPDDPLSQNGLTLRAEAVLEALRSGHAEAVILNHFSLRTASYGFPPSRKDVEKWASLADETASELADLCTVRALPYAAVISDCTD